MELPPLVLACCLMAGAFVCSLLAWMTLRSGQRTRAIILTLVALVQFSLPFFQPMEPLGWKIFMTLGCMTCACKLLDLHIGARDWRSRSFVTWVLFLFNPFVLVYRRHALRCPHPASQSLLLMLRGFLEFIAGVALIFAAYRFHVHEHSFWLDHTFKILGAYLCGYDGMFVFMTGFLRLVGCNVQELSRNPIWSATPAEFWRRYNCSANEFLYENVFKPFGGVQRPIMGIIVVFIANGLLHEYLFTVFIGKIFGYQLAFFAIQAAAVVLTFKLRPRGLWRPLGRMLTFSFNIVTCVLIATSIDIMVQGGWYGDWGSGFEPNHPMQILPFFPGKSSIP